MCLTWQFLLLTKKRQYHRPPKIEFASLCLLTTMWMEVLVTLWSLAWELTTTAALEADRIFWWKQRTITIFRICGHMWGVVTRSTITMCKPFFSLHNSHCRCSSWASRVPYIDSFSLNKKKKHPGAGWLAWWKRRLQEINLSFFFWVKCLHLEVNVWKQ